MNAAEQDARTARLVRARRDSAARKQQQALDAVDALTCGDNTVTFSAVARKARVSTWFTYNNTAVRTAIEQAIAEETSGPAPRVPEPDSDTRSQQGLRVDLAGARAEIRALRAEQTQFKQRLERSLGSHLDCAIQADNAHRVAELTAENLALIDEMTRCRAEYSEATAKIVALSVDLAGARAGLRRMMRELSSN